MRLDKRLDENYTLPSSFPLIAPMGPVGSKPVSNPNLPTNTDDEPALPDDGPPPGSLPITDPALEPYDLDGNGYLSQEEVDKALENSPDFILIFLRLDGMPVALRRFIARILNGETPGFGDIGTLRRLLRWLEGHPHWYPLVKRLLRDVDIPGIFKPFLPSELRD